ncbi:MAG TPA: right-handed parallel beta-helix repeat-containing protein [Allosphingosinicella sp.]|nr:right-handed parallel beta-helix repeat-containing protein [Allosphingosinicella sp.]
MKTGIATMLAFVAAAGSLQAQQPSAPFTLAETGRAFATLQEAVNAVGRGSGTIRIAPGRYGECAVQEAGRIAYVAETRGEAIFDGGACEGKATLVLRGKGARVEGLVFTRVRVPDGNGAGIRLQDGDLDVSFTLFSDGQSGILSHDGPPGSIRVDHSTFSGLGEGDGVHSIYIGHYGALRVTNSRFERGTGGHYVKSRAPRLEVLDNSFDDSRGRRTNYLIDVSNGAVGRIAGNVFVHGTGKENYSTMISVAPEGAENRSAGLVIENNVASVAPGFRWSTTFVGDWSGEKLEIRGNKLGPKIQSFARR